jgi:hypothetical protein
MQACCHDAPVISFSGSCDIYCNALNQTTDELMSCLGQNFGANKGNTAGILCSRNGSKPMTKWGLSLPIANKILELRESKNEGVWVDRICIGQKNSEEKKIPIGSMDIIYHACRRLLDRLWELPPSSAS